MTARVYKFPDKKNIISEPVPNNIEEAKQMVADHLASISSAEAFLELLGDQPYIPPKRTRWQRMQRHWPFRNPWEMIGAALLLVLHLGGWATLYWCIFVKGLKL